MSETNGMIKKPSSLSPIIFFTVVLVAIFLCISNPGTLHAQSMPDMRPTDSLTLALYNNQNWDELIDVGTKAIHQGLDYYYLRIRVGIAWYEKQNFRLAIRHFEKALKFNPTSQTTIEYLYYSYLLSGRKYDAEKIAPLLSEERKQKIGIDKNQFLDFVYFETGLGLYLNKNLNKWAKQRQPKDDSIYKQIVLHENLYYLHGGINLRVHPGISTYHGFGDVTVNLRQKTAYLSQPWPDFTTTVHQQEYYGNAIFAVSNGLKITSAWHFLWVNYDFRSTRYVDSLYVVVADTVPIKEKEYAAFLSVRKDLGLLALEACGSYSDFTDSQTKQLGLTIYTYPFGNLNFYTETGIIKIWNQYERNDWIFRQLLGVKLSSIVWLEASGTFGNLKDYNEGYAFTVYNTADDINFKIEGNFLFDISKHLELSLRSRYMQQKAKYFYSPDFETENLEIINKNYGYFSLIGGIKWKL